MSCIDIHFELHFCLDVFLSVQSHCVKSAQMQNFSGPYFSVFRLNTGKYRSEKNFILGHVSRSKSFGRELTFQKAFLYMFYKDLHTSNPQHKKLSFLLKVSSVRVTKSTGNCGFSNIYWINTKRKTSVFV